MGSDVRSNYYANREQLPVACVFFNIQGAKATKRQGQQGEQGNGDLPSMYPIDIVEWSVERVGNQRGKEG